MKATIIITTKNRADCLSSAVESSLSQDAEEVIVVDDGSTDETNKVMVQYKFTPRVRAYRFNSSAGYIARRNWAAAQARTPIVFSIDDDAYFSSRDVVTRTLTDFSHESIAAVAIPHVNVRHSRYIQSAPPGNGDVWVAWAFVGTAYAIRRDLFLQTGGFRDFFKHQAEEGDLCIRMLNKHFLTRLGTATPIIHNESLRRDFAKIAYFDARNSILYCWLNTPLVWLLPSLADRVLRLVRLGLGGRPMGATLRGIAAGLSEMSRFREERRPVHPTVYRLAVMLRKKALRLSEVLDVLSTARPA